MKEIQLNMKNSMKKNMNIQIMKNKANIKQLILIMINKKLQLKIKKNLQVITMKKNMKKNHKINNKYNSKSKLQNNKFNKFNKYNKKYSNNLINKTIKNQVHIIMKKNMKKKMNENDFFVFILNDLK